MSILAVLNRGRRTSTNGTAVVFGDAQLTYDQLIEQVTGTARGLRAIGVSAGSRVAVLAPNGPDALIATYGAMAAGAANVPIATTNGWQDAAGLLTRFDCTAVLYHSSLAPLVEQMRPHLPPGLRPVRIDTDTPAGELPGASSTDPALHDLNDATSAAVSGPDVKLAPPLPTPALSDIAWLGATGGTTGQPKGVMISWLAINAFLQKWAMEFPDPAPVTLLATPLSHAAGILALGNFARGGHVVITRGLGPDFLPLIAAQQVSETFLPPTAIYKLLDDPTVTTHDYSSLRTFLYGAAPMSLPRLRQAIGIFGPVMTQAYGQTECHTFITVLKPADHFIDGDTAGQIADDSRLSGCGWPTLGTTVEIRDEQGAVLPSPAVGQICVASDLAMTGYYNDPAETAKTLIDGFVHTGDMGYLDAQGCLHLVDRQKDLVITGGFNVYPAEVETVIRRHPNVGDCAVVGVPHDYWGETVVAVIVPTGGATIDPAAMLADLRTELGPVKAPKHVLLTDHLPQSAVGKILKRDIRQWATQAMAETTP